MKRDWGMVPNAMKKSLIKKNVLPPFRFHPRKDSGARRQFTKTRNKC